MLEVLYEDNHLLAVNKPAGVLTQETAEESDSLENRAKAWLKNKYLKPGNVFIGVIHRLDRPVSGIVLFAKTSKALSRLNASIRSKEMHKTYTAIVEGHPIPENDTLKHYLKHDDYRATVCSSKDPHAKLAILHYTTLKSYSRSTLIQVVLETGRYHQIRAQFAAIGCPIVGDLKYGSQQQTSKGVIALHHSQLIVVHPITQENICIESHPNDILLLNL
jgi:23S rRNA pseudouridine1911/1915/1917 synthase